jgi:DNA-binding transcriptional LysR family regulator
VSATERLVEPRSGGDRDADGYDAAIRLGRAGLGRTLACDFLFLDRRIVVASPAYRAARPLVAAAPDPPAGHALLEALSADCFWRDWAEAQGWPVPTARRLGFGDERLVAEAALGGLGLALVDRALVAEPLAAGRLAAPLGARELTRGTAWFLVYAAADPLPPAIAALREWLLDETAG